MRDISTDSTRKKRFSRRDFLKLSTSMGMTMLLATGTEPSWLEVTHVRLALPRLPTALSGMRLAQISDIHMGGWMDGARLRDVLEQVRLLAPDVVAITGDFVYNSTEGSTVEAQLLEMETELAALAQLYPTLAVLGNHDYWYDQAVTSIMLERAGVRVLDNSVQRLQASGESIFVAGVGDVLVKQDRLDTVLASLPDQGCAILLAHEPDFADESAASGRFDLQLSGHSHGGQVNIPFLGAPILPQLARKYPQGLYQVGNMFQYTNRGVGMVPPFVRVNCRPEITLFTLDAAG